MPRKESIILLRGDFFMRKLNKKAVDSILFSILLSAVTASCAMLFTDTKSVWYQGLIKPPFQPPAFVFVAGWTLIYLLFAASFSVALYLSAGKKIYFLYALQCVFNVLWCFLFFFLHMPLSAFPVLIAYLVTTYLTVRGMFPINKNSAYLLLVQILWLTFASVLNYAIILLN